MVFLWGAVAIFWAIVFVMSVSGHIRNVVDQTSNRTITINISADGVSLILLVVFTILAARS